MGEREREEGKEVKREREREEGKEVKREREREEGKEVKRERERAWEIKEVWEGNRTGWK